VWLRLGVKLPRAHDALMKIVSVVGARPNFVKISPLLAEMRKHSDVCSFLVNTGQHYDANMADQFFQELEIPRPDVSLEVGSGSHAYQTAEVMRRLEPVLGRQSPDAVLVVGDVNSTLATALTAAKLGIRVAHVEAGLRSFDRSMPEEVNRLLTDAISDYLFLTDEGARQNLLREGIAEDKIFFVGNVMIDSLEGYRSLWERSQILTQFELLRGAYGVVTLHRPSNVDDPRALGSLLRALSEVARELPVVFPCHPRTRMRIAQMNGSVSGLEPRGDRASTTGIRCVDPLGYLDFMALVASARIVFTDSGGLQEETAVLGVPCLTLRENTERPVTVTHGTNRVVGTSPARIVQEAIRVLQTPAPAPSRPPLWDGNTSERIVAILRDRLQR
jgi:UDP-N-acetylglucosamine 2-epimerase (non-hydrolysing)